MFSSAKALFLWVPPVNYMGCWNAVEHFMCCIAMWMVLPNQAGSLQGPWNVSCKFLGANDLGTGSGWRQSKHNWTLAAVVGHWVRMACRNLCCAEDAPHQPFVWKQRPTCNFDDFCQLWGQPHFMPKTVRQGTKTIQICGLWPVPHMGCWNVLEHFMSCMPCG